MSSTSPPKINVLVYSDLAWPWCHVGHKRLEQAVQETVSSSQQTSGSSTIGNGIINVEWKPYMIDPQTKSEGEKYLAYNRRRWGGDGWTGHLKHEGQKDGYGANFQNWKWWPNTFKAHQLIQYMIESGAGSNLDTHTMNRILMEEIYEHGNNISLVDNLVDIATERMGLAASKQEDLRQYLLQDKGGKQVKDEIRQGQQKYRIRGVPFFIISKTDSNGRPYGLSGAQSKDAFQGVFEEFLED